MCPKDGTHYDADSLVDPGQIAPSGAVWSGTTLFAQT